MSYSIEPSENNSTTPNTYDNHKLDKNNRTIEKINFDRTAKNLPCRPTVEVHNQFEDAFDYANQKLFYPHFGIYLPHVIFSTPKSARFMGYFIRNLWNKESETNTKASEIALNPFFFNDPLETCKTLVHEMMHLAQAEYPKVFGKPGNGGYHNKTFAYAMIKIGLMPSSTGKEGGAITGIRMSEYIILGGPFDYVFQEYLSTGDKFVWTVRPTNFSDKTSEQDGNNTVSECKRRSKTKYTCPACTLNAWAKPGAKLVCGSCSTSLIEVKP